MPELPEVETIVRALNKSVKGRIFKDVIILHKNIVEGNEKSFIDQIKNKQINEIKRRGKFIIFDLSGPNVLLAHLRMEGKFLPGKSLNEKSEYARVVFLFKDGTILNFDDSRCFGFLAIRNKTNYNDVLPLSKVGVEAIDPNLNVDHVYQLIHSSKRNIKETLLDQSIVSGLGNIYVDETLFKAKISPLSKANLLTKEEIKTILKYANEILQLAIKYHGTTVISFLWEKGHAGGYQKYLQAYGKKGDYCERCGTPLIKIKVGGRGTTYCYKCQKLKTNKYVLGITGPISSGKSTALQELKKMGYIAYSADEAVNNLYKEPYFKKELQKLFKKDSKDEIRKIVTNDKKQLTKLNKLIHPIIKNDIKNFIAKHDGKLALEIPLLFQVKLDDLMDETLLILSKQNLHLIQNRGAKAQEQISINSNLDYKHFQFQATYVITNDTTLDNFKKEINKIFNR